jgi:hypothetical protein
VDELAERADAGQFAEQTFDERGATSSQSTQIENLCHFAPPSLVSIV